MFVGDLVEYMVFDMDTSLGLRSKSSWHPSSVRARLCFRSTVFDVKVVCVCNAYPRDIHCASPMGLG